MAGGLHVAAGTSANVGLSSVHLNGSAHHSPNLKCPCSPKEHSLSRVRQAVPRQTQQRLRLHLQLHANPKLSLKHSQNASQSHMCRAREQRLIPSLSACSGRSLVEGLCSPRRSCSILARIQTSQRSHCGTPVQLLKLLEAITTRRTEAGAA